MRKEKYIKEFGKSKKGTSAFSQLVRETKKKISEKGPNARKDQMLVGVRIMWSQGKDKS